MWKQGDETEFTCFFIDSLLSKMMSRFAAWSVGTGDGPGSAGHYVSFHGEVFFPNDEDFRLVCVELETVVLYW